MGELLKELAQLVCLGLFTATFTLCNWRMAQAACMSRREIAGYSLVMLVTFPLTWLLGVAGS